MNYGKLIIKSCRDDLIEFEFDGNLKKKFANTYKFANQDINRLILQLRKSVYPYECIDIWKRKNETSLPGKHVFYSHLNMEDITDADYKLAKRTFKDFKTKHLFKILIILL